MRHGASGACRSRSPALRRRWSRPRAEAVEARRGVEPRSTILQTVLLPEQRAVGAGSGNRTRAVGLADRHSTFEPYLHESGVPESNRACCVGSAVVRLEQTPRGVAGYRPRRACLQGKRAAFRTTPYGEASVPPASRLASLGAVKGLKQSRTDSESDRASAVLETAHLPEVCPCAAYEDRTRLTRSTIELRLQSHHAALKSIGPADSRTRAKRVAAPEGRRRRARGRCGRGALG
jgi:hypothetical protein